MRKVSEKTGLCLPYGEMTFIVDELDGVSRYPSCLLTSPPSHSISAQEGMRPTDDCARMLLLLPVGDLNVPQLDRCVLSLGYWNCENA